MDARDAAPMGLHCMKSPPPHPVQALLTARRTVVLPDISPGTMEAMEGAGRPEGATKAAFNRHNWTVSFTGPASSMDSGALRQSLETMRHHLVSQTLCAPLPAAEVGADPPNGMALVIGA